jgi:hypothetical protein
VSTNRPASDERSRPRSHLFLVRIWKAEGTAAVEYRANVRDVVSGATRSFRNWPDVTDFMVTQVEQAEDLDAEQAD